jgi:hypothetical protein
MKVNDYLGHASINRGVILKCILKLGFQNVDELM